MVWKELTYDDETHHPFNKERPANKVEFDNELFNWYKKMISIRKNNIELSIGKLEFEILGEGNNILLIVRKFENDESFIIINSTDDELKFEIDFKEYSNHNNSFTELISGNKFDLDNSVLVYSLDPYQILILK